MDNFSKACQEFSLIISLKKINVIGECVEQPPIVKINDDLEVVHEFTQLHRF